MPEKNVEKLSKYDKRCQVLLLENFGIGCILIVQNNKRKGNENGVYLYTSSKNFNFQTHR